MAKFLSEIIIMLALGVVLYLMARALPRVDDIETTPSKALELHWFTPILEKIDERLKRFLERLFRRLKVVILKLDNFVSARLSKVKREEPREVGLPLAEETVEEGGPNEESKTQKE